MVSPMAADPPWVILLGDAWHHDGAGEIEGAGASAVPWQVGVVFFGFGDDWSDLFFSVFRRLDEIGWLIQLIQETHMYGISEFIFCIQARLEFFTCTQLEV